MPIIGHAKQLTEILNICIKTYYNVHYYSGAADIALETRCVKWNTKFSSTSSGGYHTEQKCKVHQYTRYIPCIKGKPSQYHFNTGKSFSVTIPQAVSTLHSHYPQATYLWSFELLYYSFPLYFFHWPNPEDQYVVHTYINILKQYNLIKYDTLYWKTIKLFLFNFVFHLGLHQTCFSSKLPKLYNM